MRRKLRRNRWLHPFLYGLRLKGVGMAAICHALPVNVRFPFGFAPQGETDGGILLNDSMKSSLHSDSQSAGCFLNGGSTQPAVLYRQSAQLPCQTL